MNLKTFKDKNKKKRGISIGFISVFLLSSLVLIIKTYAVYEEQQEYNMIKGIVPEMSDVTVSFYQVDVNGNKTVIKEIPAGKEYDVTVDCNKGATGSWNTTTWGLSIKNLTNTMTKCNIAFAPQKPLLTDTIRAVPIVTNGTGMYQVTHDDAVIEAPLSNVEKTNLKQTEYRYAGSNPDNYVTFNNELWRIIGLVNTSEGQKIKLIRNESIGDYPWDSSEISINSGNGINEWNQADIMKLINPGYESETVGGSLYYNKQKGNCYSDSKNANKACDFTSTGLSDTAKNMISNTVWNIGSNGTNNYQITATGLSKYFYNYERSNNGKICTSGSYCNDSTIRTTTWRGKVGLMTPSDYGYATSGGSTTIRETCLNKEMFNWADSSVNDCKTNDWLYTSTNQWTIIPLAHASIASYVFSVRSAGSVNYNNASGADAVRPSIYLYSDIRVASGVGTLNNPYLLA